MDDYWDYDEDHQALVNRVLRLSSKKETKMMTHRTADGDTVPLAGMSDSHLLNTIAYFGKDLARLTEESERRVEARTLRGAALYGETTWDPDAYVEAVTRYYQQAGPYVVEAGIRGLNVQPILAKIMGRDRQDPEAPTIPERNNPVAGLMSREWVPEFRAALGEAVDETV